MDPRFDSDVKLYEHLRILHGLVEIVWKSDNSEAEMLSASIATYGLRIIISAWWFSLTALPGPSLLDVSLN